MVSLFIRQKIDHFRVNWNGASIFLLCKSGVVELYSRTKEKIRKDGLKVEK
jgi:hypothetical protein